MVHISRRTFLVALTGGRAAVLKGAPLARVLLIGDSISMGYIGPVRKLLADQATVAGLPVNGGPTTNGLENLTSWLGDGSWDVIHFNWGLHDLKLDEQGQHQVPLAQYEKNLRELVARLKATGAKLIWASTTPVPPVPAEKLNPRRDSRDVPVYNAAAKKIMDENGTPIDDLYAFALARLEAIQQPANVHYTDAGYEALAGEVAGAIRQALGRRS
jgi:lysophospholipase L1-like esterase